jgi:hypothetical protein
MNNQQTKAETPPTTPRKRLKKPSAERFNGYAELGRDVFSAIEDAVVQVEDVRTDDEELLDVLRNAALDSIRKAITPQMVAELHAKKLKEKSDRLFAFARRNQTGPDRNHQQAPPEGGQ